MALYLPDANILIHALRQDSPHHAACREWLLQCTAASHRIGLTEPIEAALLRIPTLPKLNLVPMPEVIAFWLDDLWTYPGTVRLSAGPAHGDTLKQLITKLELRGNDINDAWLAALAIDQRATLVSTDIGFQRFPGLSWLNPLTQ